MKKHYYLYAIAILALIAVLPTVTKAEQGSDDATSNTSASAQINTTAGVRILTPLEKLRAAKDAKEANIQKNEDARNNILQRIEMEKRKLGSTTPPRVVIKGDVRVMASSTRAERQEIGDDRREENKDIRQEGREDMKNASSGGERREIRKDMHKDEFKIRKDAVVRQLNVTLNNLKQIRARISSRIDRATAEGRDMTNAKRLLVIADSKITLAEQAINTVLVLNPTATSTATASSTIDLRKPREVGDTAIKALKKAHEALVAVVVAIAHSMGLGNATTTPPIIPPPPVTATTTATTTTTITI